MMRRDRPTEGAQEVLAQSQQLVRTEQHSKWDAPSTGRALSPTAIQKHENYQTNFEVTEQ